MHRLLLPALARLTHESLVSVLIAELTRASKQPSGDTAVHSTLLRSTHWGESLRHAHAYSCATEASSHNLRSLPGFCGTIDTGVKYLWCQHAWLCPPFEPVSLLITSSHLSPPGPSYLHSLPSLPSSSLFLLPHLPSPSYPSLPLSPSLPTH